MDKATALEALSPYHQQHLLRFWDQLSAAERERLLQQIEALDFPLLRKQQAFVRDNSLASASYRPFQDYSRSGNATDRKRGEALLAEGKMGCLLIAGGQGTRLRFNGPKGLVPITSIRHKTIFQFFAERVAAASRLAKRPLPLAIMTSPLNHLATWNTFVSNHFFGLEPDQVSFVVQGMLPLLDRHGNLFLSQPDRIAEGPDGNGKALEHFIKDGLLKKWTDQGVHYLNYVLIDNPLADPFDAELLGFHVRQEADLTIKCTSRRNVDEKVGVVTRCGDHLEVVEYSEIDESERLASNADGSLKHNCANLSLFCFSLDFIQRMHTVALPLHKALKSAVELGNETKAWKFEYFIFDLLPHAKKGAVLLYPRDECFAPLKNASGEDSLSTVQLALQRDARRRFAALTGTIPPDRPFELAPDFYYPTAALIKRWQGRPLPDTDYILA